MIIKHPIDNLINQVRHDSSQFQTTISPEIKKKIYSLTSSELDITICNFINEAYEASKETNENIDEDIEKLIKIYIEFRNKFYNESIKRI